ncbi:MAG: omcB [Phycisphaerales bacterium]|nr:omcB [Phycisphaerales bacterium]
MTEIRPTLKGLMAIALATAIVGCAPQNQNPVGPIGTTGGGTYSAVTSPPAPRPTPTPAPTTPSAPAAIEGSQIVGNQVRGKLYFPTGDAATSALLLEKSLPTEVQVNKPFVYDIKVTNVAKLKLEGVEISETVPGTFKIKDVTEGNADGKANTVTYLVGTLEPGDSKIVRLTGTAAQSGPLGTCISAKYNTSLCMATTVVAPALKLAITGSADSMKGDTLSYKLVVTNTGSGEAKNVKVESVLPDGVVTPDGKAAVAFDAGNLGGGESKDFSFSAKANKTGTYPIKATARADEGLASEPAALSTAVKAPWLQIAKTGPEKAFIGQPITYEISVTNKGDGVAKDTMIFDNLPAGVAVQFATDNARSDGSGKVKWEAGDLAPGATKKVAIVVTAAAAGEMKTAASASAAGADTQAAFASTTLVGVPAILVQMADSVDPVRVGDQTTYTVEITNTGTAPGTNIKLVCTLEEQAEFVNATGTTKEKVDGKVITFNPVGSLLPKAKAVYKLTVRASKPGDTRFKTSITSDQLGRPVESTESTNFFGN